MASLRRSAATMQRAGEEFMDPSPSPKLYYSRTYFAFRGLLNSFLISLNLVALYTKVKANCSVLLLQRHPRTPERSKSRGISWKKVSFHFVIFFTFGIFIGFMPFFSIDISKIIAYQHEGFTVEENITADSIQQKSYSVKEEVLLFEPETNDTTAAILNVKNESLDASYRKPTFNETSNDSDFIARKLLIIVTPTYVRPFQAYYLTRLAHVLRLVPSPLLWIVVEMSSQSVETAQILRTTGVMYRHLICEHNQTGIKKNVACQRNVALSHIEKHHLDGIVYFADDDQMHLVDLFEEMRKIRRFGTWPVAMLSGSKNKVLLEGPLCSGSQVIGWQTNQRSRVPRRFLTDLSGFAFNSTILWDPLRWHRPNFDAIRLRGSGKEIRFIQQLVEDESQMEGLADNCSRIMVWHQNLESPDLNHPIGWLMQKSLEVVVPLT
ncbi:probable beta-1,4-xylosyltransferase GT43E [Typha angustifolia]|uniref:probable beta-1,4-xylosyltransferase GT43E n=1 Tax=Typha angustifolia TaxID=59011 RepID=UPI003C2E12DD